MHEIIETRKKNQSGAEINYPIAKIILNKDTLILHALSSEPTFLDHHQRKAQIKNNDHAKIINGLLLSYVRNREIEGGEEVQFEIEVINSTTVKLKGNFTDMLDALIKRGLVSEETGVKLCTAYVQANISDVVTLQSASFQKQAIFSYNKV